MIIRRTIAVDIEIVSDFLSIFLEGVALSGVFIAYAQANPAAAIQRVQDKIAFWHAVTRAVERFLPSMSISDTTPVIYNSVAWSEKALLGGYANRETKLSEVIASYLGCWQEQSNGKQSVRFARAALSRMKETDSIVSGFSYIVDLYRHGYFPSRARFFSELNYLIQLYCRHINSSDLLKIFAKGPLFG
jgi:hypothetical protein